MMKNKKFQTGKLAKKAAGEMEVLKEQALELLDPAAREAMKEAEEAMQRMQEARGPSLMEQHMKAREENADKGQQQRRSFDRERVCIIWLNVG